MKKYWKQIRRTFAHFTGKPLPECLLQASYGKRAVLTSDAILLHVTVACDCNWPFWSCNLPIIIIIVIIIIAVVIMIHHQLQSLKLIRSVHIHFKVVLISASSFRSYQFSSSLSFMQCQLWQVISFILNSRFSFDVTPCNVTGSRIRRNLLHAYS
jgi:hypothetical protein